MTLDQLGLKYGTDKSSAHHNYLYIYDKYFSPLREEKIALLELGYGGYQYEDRGGQSARMWLEYFTNARIHVSDLHNKINLPKDYRFTFNHGGYDSQYQVFKIIIDDASHINTDTIENFNKYWKNLVSGGIYVVEDTECSYWEDIAVDGTDFKGTRNTTDLKVLSVMNYFKLLCDAINLSEENQIEAIHFYKGLIFILKK